MGDFVCKSQSIILNISKLTKSYMKDRALQLKRKSLIVSGFFYNNQI